MLGLEPLDVLVEETEQRRQITLGESIVGFLDESSVG
jgi:hypothetical protein